MPARSSASRPRCTWWASRGSTSRTQASPSMQPLAPPAAPGLRPSPARAARGCLHGWRHHLLGPYWAGQVGGVARFASLHGQHDWPSSSMTWKSISSVCLSSSLFRGQQILQESEVLLIVGCPRLKYAFCQYLLESGACLQLQRHACSYCQPLQGSCRGPQSPVEGQGPPQTVTVQHLHDVSVSLAFQIERQLSSSREGVSSVEARMSLYRHCKQAM